MSDIPLVSVVLPVYNCAAYIEEALNSILQQTVQDFEILIIDDASTDSTVALVESYHDPRIKVIRKKENKGLVDSLNIGFRAAIGKYIARMDGDDISVSQRFEKQLALLRANPEIKACGSWLQSFGAYDRLIKHKEKHEEIQARLLISNPMSLGATMLEREAYHEFKFDASMIHVEDYDLWARTAWSCKMHNIQEVLYRYRVHQTQVSTKHKEIQLQGDMAVKMPLFKKLEYDTSRFTDALIAKVLYSNKSVALAEWKLIFKWFAILVSQNERLKVFDSLALKNVIFEIRRKLVFDIFFLNNRQDMDYHLRKQILIILPIKEQVFILKQKLVEKWKMV